MVPGHRLLAPQLLRGHPVDTVELGQDAGVLLLHFRLDEREVVEGRLGGLQGL